MLNISPHNSIEGKFNKSRYSAFKNIYNIKAGIILARILIALFIAFMAIMFLPWTQNIRSNGQVIGLKPQNRTQDVQTIISGSIKEWYVQEGDTVRKGDTIIQITEVKDKYFDPALIQRTRNQIESKRNALSSYEGKIASLKQQKEALVQMRELKLQQLTNKIEQTQMQINSDSNTLKAANTDLEIAKNQFERIKNLHEKGLKSLTQLQEKRQKYQSAQAKQISAKNKLSISQNKLTNLKIDRSTIKSEYQDKISKAQSGINSAQANFFDAQATISKMENDLTNYESRSNYHYVTAPQDGIINNAISKGIGEIVKSSTSVVNIMPREFSAAAELYVAPINYPLLSKGESVRLMFDGWPSIVFSGWPNVSTGTFEGTIVAIDNHISPNGKFRILVKPSEDWPDPIRSGSGARGIILLKEVPVWYEIWRQLNGFPPEYYKNNQQKGNVKAQK